MTPDRLRSDRPSPDGQLSDRLDNTVLNIAPKTISEPKVGLAAIAGLVLLVYGIIRGGDAGSWARPAVVLPILGGFAVLALFCVHESRTEHPSLDVKLFRDPRISSASVAIGLNFFAMSGV